jgi:hypothetical protein
MRRAIRNAISEEEMEQLMELMDAYQDAKHQLDVAVVERNMRSAENLGYVCSTLAKDMEAILNAMIDKRIKQVSG